MRGNERVLKAYKVDDGYSLLFFSESECGYLAVGAEGFPPPSSIWHIILFLEGFLLSEP